MKEKSESGFDLGSPLNKEWIDYVIKKEPRCIGVDYAAGQDRTVFTEIMSPEDVKPSSSSMLEDMCRLSNEMRHMRAMPRIVQNEFLTVPVEDWSKVRSPSRAKRRMKKGHRQNVRIIYVPSHEVYRMALPGTPETLVMHPEKYKELGRKLDKSIKEAMYNAAYSGLAGDKK